MTTRQDQKRSERFRLVDCKACDGSGYTYRPEGWKTAACPCRWRRPCDLMCRCSGGPL